jgi:integrase
LCLLTVERQTVLAPESAVTLLAHLRGSRLYLPVLLAITTGMRRGEILGLTWPQVDLRSRLIHVTQALAGTLHGAPVFGGTKTRGSRRAVAVPDSMFAARQTEHDRQIALKQVLGEDYQDYGLVVCVEDGRAWDPSNFTKAFRLALAALGLGSIRFHDLRHSHATMLLSEGVHPKVVSERLGHSQVKITLDTYSHVLPVLQREAADLIDRALTNSGPVGLQSVCSGNEKGPPH